MSTHVQAKDLTRRNDVRERTKRQHIDRSEASRISAAYRRLGSFSHSVRRRTAVVLLYGWGQTKSTSKQQSAGVEDDDVVDIGA